MKFLKALAGLFTNNWWLKIIALLLAIVIYHSEKTDRSRTQKQSSHDRSLLQFR